MGFIPCGAEKPSHLEHLPQNTSILMCFELDRKVKWAEGAEQFHYVMTIEI